MPLEMPATDKLTGKCGMRHGDSHKTGPCNQPGVARVAVPVAGHDDDYEYRYSSVFQVAFYGEVLVDICAEHEAEMNEEFAEEAAKVADREARQDAAAAKIREAEAALEEAKRAYPGTWRD